MPFADRFQQIRRVPLVRLAQGHSRTLGDFYSNIIEPNLPSVDAVRSWYDLLRWYVDEPDAIFFLRKYGNTEDRDGGWTQIRRGFYTAFERGGYVFCDNFFAHYFYLLAKGWADVPDRDDFKQAILTRSIPYGSSFSRRESPYQAFPHGPAPTLNYYGWKLAHLLDVNRRWRHFNPTRFTAEHFPRGEYADWVQNDGYPVRLMGREMTDEERRFMKIHLLRLCCPVNYFPVPKTGCERDGLGNNIGENIQLLQYVRLRFEARYGDVFADFFANVDVPEDYPPAADKKGVVADIEYNPNRFGGEARENAEVHPPRGDRNRQRRVPNREEQQPQIVLDPPDPVEFKARLIQTKRARRVLSYADGREEVKPWNAANFAENTNLMGNIKSSAYWKHRMETGLTRVAITVID